MLYSFLCFIFVRTFRGYVKISYVCLLFWPCPLLNLSPLLLFYYNFVNKSILCLILSWE